MPAGRPAHGFTVQYNGRSRSLVTECHVSEAFDPKSPQPHPEMKPFHCIWDTGATNTVINSKVVATLGLKPIGKEPVQTAGGPRIANKYLVNVRLPNRVGFQALSVTEGELLGAEDVLIGMDIIGVGDFAVTHKDGRTCLTYCIPSIKRIDLVEEADIYNRRAGFGQPSADERRRERNRAKAERRRHR